MNRERSCLVNRSSQTSPASSSAEPASANARAKAFIGTDIGKLLAGDVITSLDSLTAAKKDVLRTALSLVSPDALKDGTGGVVSAGNGYFALRTANHPATIKRVRRSLERKGFALRHTDGDHNEARFDIRPFLANLEELLDQFLEAQRTRRDAYSVNHQFVTVEDEMLPRPHRPRLDRRRYGIERAATPPVRSLRAVIRSRLIPAPLSGQENL